MTREQMQSHRRAKRIALKSASVKLNCCIEEIFRLACAAGYVQDYCQKYQKYLEKNLVPEGVYDFSILLMSDRIVPLTTKRRKARKRT